MELQTKVAHRNVMKRGLIILGFRTMPAECKNASKTCKAYFALGRSCAETESYQPSYLGTYKGVGNYAQKGDYDKPVKLEDALTIAGFGRYNLLAIAGGGVSLLGGLGILLGLSYTLPATDCDMPLSPTEKGFVASAAFTGILFSSHLYGYLSDTYGRRKIVILSNYSCSLVTFLAAFSPNAYVLSAMSFTNGFLASGLLTPAYVFMSEFCAMDKRATALLIGSAIAALATSILPGLAWIIIPLNFRISLFYGVELTPWRVYIALLSIPMLLCNVIMHFLEESPKFLISKGRKEETLEVLKTIYAFNYSAPKKTYPVTNVQVDDSDIVPDAKKVNILMDIWRQTVTLFSPPLISYMVVSCALNLGLIGSYNVTMLWLPELISRMSLYDDDHDVYDSGICDVFNYKEEVILNKTEANVTYEVVTECQTKVNESVYIATMIIGISQFVFFGVMSVLSERYSRRGLIVSCLVVGAISYMATPFMTSMMLTISTFGIVVVFVGAALPLAMSIIVDFFPTYLRGMATCICMIFGRLGASFGGQVFGILQLSYCQYSYYGLSIILLSISALCFIIPLNRKP